MNVLTSLVLTYLYIIVVRSHDKNPPNQPHIVLIIADDLGWNDVSFHGANQIPTPNIDALAYNGVILNRFYTLPSCTPSRAALLTGQYPIRLGLQGWPIKAGENRHLPLDTHTLPQRLKELGYSTQLVGKWHLGSAYRNVTPTSRGFDYHFGYWHGYIGYFDHQAHTNVTAAPLQRMCGLDMHDNLETMWSTQNQYVTTLLTTKAEEIIWAHNDSTPLFLMVSHLAPHAGKGGTGLEVPDVNENNKGFAYIRDENRRLYAGMVNELDKSVGIVVEALSKKQMLNNSLIVFTSDNGAQPTGMMQNSGSNWPLRGMKLTVLEGGVRNVAILYSPQLQNKGSISNELVHIADLMPTLYAAAGGDTSQLGDIDGINQWLSLMTGQKSNRTGMLLNIDEANNCSALIGENGQYKLVNGSTIVETYDRYYGDDGRDSSNPPYNATAILRSATNIAIRGGLTEDQLLQLRRNSDLGNCRFLNAEHRECNGSNLCLFDLLGDPCETKNVAEEFPEVVARLSRELLAYWAQLQPQANTFVDPKANPVYFNNSWHTWLDI